MLWSIHPDNAARLDDIREKVQSKLKTAELLAAVLGLAIAAVLALLLDRGRWRNLAYVDESNRRPRVQPFGLEWDLVSFEPRTGVQFAVVMLLAALALYSDDRLRLRQPPNATLILERAPAHPSVGPIRATLASQAAAKFVCLGHLPEHDANLGHIVRPGHPAGTRCLHHLGHLAVGLEPHRLGLVARRGSARSRSLLEALLPSGTWQR